MNQFIGPRPPFEEGERVVPASLVGWRYVGLTGIPDQPKAARRYVKGMWVLELAAFSDRKRMAKVVSMRTESEDKAWWAKQRTGRGLVA